MGPCSSLFATDLLISSSSSRSPLQLLDYEAACAAVWVSWNILLWSGFYLRLTALQIIYLISWWKENMQIFSPKSKKLPEMLHLCFCDKQARSSTLSFTSEGIFISCYVLDSGLPKTSKSWKDTDFPRHYLCVYISSI